VRLAPHRLKRALRARKRPAFSMSMAVLGQEEGG
jgi:hypothetical protein